MCVGVSRIMNTIPIRLEKHSRNGFSKEKKGVFDYAVSAHIITHSHTLAKQSICDQYLSLSLSLCCLVNAGVCPNIYMARIATPIYD